MSLNLLSFMIHFLCRPRGTSLAGVRRSLQGAAHPFPGPILERSHSLGVAFKGHLGSGSQTSKFLLPDEGCGTLADRQEGISNL